MKFSLFVLAILLLCRPAGADLASDLDRESAKIGPVMQAAGDLVFQGHSKDAEEKILATFPEKDRTPVQTLLLGNVLFRSDQKLSYALHKAAAEAMPDETQPAFEWALELHRAGDWDKAADQYRKFITAHPDDGVAWGLLAECLLRTDHTKQACDAWEKSEQGQGTLEAFESIDCEVHTHDSPDTVRSDLADKVRAGDVDAAQKLVEIDCRYPQDWWNVGPDPRRLKADLAMIGNITITDQRRLAAITAAARCGIILSGGDGSAKEVLKSAGFLLDDKQTLPPSGDLLSVMLAASLEDRSISLATARTKIGPAVLEAAKKTKDAEMYNIAAKLFGNTDKLAEIDQAGWDDTGEARFAESRIVGLDGKGLLKEDDPLLLRAEKQFPDDSLIATIRLRIAHKDNKMTDALIVHAIECECTHFSPQSELGNMRPRATAIRVFYKLLAQRLKTPA